jgi:hypothetical protein
MAFVTFDQVFASTSSTSFWAAVIDVSTFFLLGHFIHHRLKTRLAHTLVVHVQVFTLSLRATGVANTVVNGQTLPHVREASRALTAYAEECGA